MYRMFTSNKDASPLCRAERSGECSGDTCEMPSGLPGVRGRPVREVTPGFGGRVQSKTQEGSAPAWQLLPTHLPSSK